MSPEPPRIAYLRAQVKDLRDQRDELSGQVERLQFTLAAQVAESNAADKRWRDASDGMGQRIVDLTAALNAANDIIAGQRIALDSAIRKLAEFEEVRALHEQGYSDNLISLHAQAERLRLGEWAARGGIAQILAARAGVAPGEISDAEIDAACLPLPTPAGAR